MTYTFSFSYLGCQTCQAHIHCKECGERLGGMLMGREGVKSVEMQMAEKQLTIETDMDRDTLEEAMEDLGIFA